MKPHASALFAVLGLAASTSLHADVVPSTLFQDHAVLQRDKPLPVWGKADAGEAVTVSFAGQTRRTVADAEGRWSVTLEPLPANSEPATLTIAGNNTVTLHDIVVGEVWLASGQSNMEWRLSNSHDVDMERLTARFPLIRELRVARRAAGQPATEFAGEWTRATPETAGAFSAVGYAFAKDLHLALDVPVGILNSAWGGTPVEAWMAPEVLDSDPAFAPVRERWAQVLAEYPARKAEHDDALAAWRSEKEAAEARGEVFERSQPRAPDGPGSHRGPAALYNGMIAPLVPAALRGAIWYQGESNAGRAAEYHALFAAMIEGWRADFAQGDFPFYWAQLAAFRAGDANRDNWAFLREAQDRTLALPATGQAVILDAALSDYGDIHPRAKMPVGRRLARLALARAHGIDGLADSGPRFAGVEPAEEGAALRVNFAGGTGRLRHPAPELTAFEVAGEDREFHPARARIERDGVIVRADSVPAPVAVRYAWRNHPVAWLQDNLGLPVPPFRSDDW